MSISLEGKKIKPAFKLWFEIGDKYVFGEGTCTLLEQIKKRKSISAAARATNMSYRYAWDLIKEVGKHLGEPVIKTQKGGKHGGKSELTTAGLLLLTSYKKLKKTMTKACKLQ
ncbi:LysR family transcriptional regulator [Candidatus Bathyarchaeota archaeon]|nr:LysR family transcriptional regulator [Candidatus Bathyarchaeota archaeon]MCK4481769.1 LysR family transcriptional regulator [Candidatus Bathyarchaeota archaeon]